VSCPVREMSSPRVGNPRVGVSASCPVTVLDGVPTQLNSTQLNEHLWTQVLKHLNVHIYLDTISYRYQLISRTDLSPVRERGTAAPSLRSMSIVATVARLSYCRALLQVTTACSCTAVQAMIIPPYLLITIHSFIHSFIEHSLEFCCLPVCENNVGCVVN